MNPVRPTVLLYDIDGTLIDSGGAGRKAVRTAFETAYGEPDACEGLLFAGRTDRGIFRIGLEAVGAPTHDAEIERLIGLYLEALAEVITRSPRYRVHPGIPALLDILPPSERVAIGLGTGNVEAGARIKLEPAGLWERFQFGGYGSDDEDRPALIRVGAERGAAILGHSLDACRVVIIGDTPRDVAAAHAIGAECLAVATGHHSLDELRESGAERVVANLEAPEALPFLRGFRS